MRSAFYELQSYWIQLSPESLSVVRFLEAPDETSAAPAEFHELRHESYADIPPPNAPTNRSASNKQSGLVTIFDRGVSFTAGAAAPTP
jgi:hypothetical protein